MTRAEQPSGTLLGVCRALAPVTLAVSISCAIAVDARADCRDVAQSLRAALAAGDPDAAAERYGDVLSEDSCDGAFRERAGRAVSVLHARVAQERVAAGETLASQRSLLERGLTFGETWPLLALLGDLAREDRQHGLAAERYQKALTAIQDTVETPQPPPTAEIERIFRLASQSRLLAAEYRPSPATRSGEPGGLAATNIRGFKVERVAVPITFHTATATFTEEGRRAAMDMVVYLKAQKSSQITIEGHTDPRGSDAYNLDLSRQRAEAVAHFLRDGGFVGRIVVVAKGESERFPVEEPGAYTQAQRWQMDRRVELVR